MYPKVKVRSVEEDDGNDRRDTALQSLDAFDTLSIRVPSSSVKEHKHNSPSSITKVRRSSIPRSLTTPPLPKSVISALTAIEKSQKEEEEHDKPHVRASSIPRPRAVLSSPDNDQILGSKSKIQVQRSSALKDHSSAQNRHFKSRCTPTNSMADNAVKRHTECKEAAAKRDIKVKEGLAVSTRTKRALIGKEKLNITRV